MLGWLVWMACAPPAPVAVVSADRAYDRVLEDLTFSLEAHERGLTGRDWTQHERLAAGYLQVARLTGDFDPYDDALGHLDQAFEVAPPGSGPHATAAAVYASLHRLPDAQAALDAAWTARPFHDDIAAAGLHRLGGEIAWQRGDYEDAADAFAVALALDAAYDTWSAEAHLRSYTADYPGANEAYGTALSTLPSTEGVSAAWVHLQQGLVDLERDRFEAALQHYLDADAALGGWWLVQEHIAEVLVAVGREDEAADLYADVVARTGHPAMRDAWAGLLEPEEARTQVEAARAAWDAQRARFPEAVSGHALDHYLEHGTPAESLAVAEANVDARPNAASWLGLAEARLRADDLPGAVAAIDSALSTPWRTPALHDAAATIYDAAGRPDDARAQRALGQALRGGD